jgi:hypothetical protein
VPPRFRVGKERTAVSTYILQRCKLRNDRVVPLKEEAQVWSWGRLLEHFVPARRVHEAKRLLAIRVGSYIALGPSRFGGVAAVVVNVPDQTNSLRFFLRKQPHLVDAIQEIWWVRDVLGSSRIEEPADQLAREPSPPARMMA